MVVIDEKSMIPPPPPYAAARSIAPQQFSGGRSYQTIASLPSHILLKILYMTFPQTPGIDESRHERQRKTLYWLSHHLRLVNKSFYIACMHVLRSAYLPSYGSLIRAPYTSDPFSLASSTSSATGPVQTTQRETQVLDLFIALKVREDVLIDDTEFHIEREELFRDLFDLMQPRSRLEDLVRHYGLREGVVHTNPPGVSLSASASSSQLHGSIGSSSSGKRRSTTRRAPLPFSTLSVSFSPRTAGLLLATTTRKRTIVEVARTRDEKLEVTAKKLVGQLKVWLNDS